ncbi:hypothetical protein [Peribacillus frigoritolerans]|uniref:hypothetical protein n=1 Tax=Peribacillus frigoritolerans TaxID=450367 RepID=UPI00107137AF|nr:hypothetical protein [Peribacillus frigoritolerans]TFH62599.1 hypothetical protein E4J71_02000 [Peribacillus frigoritolerans]
MPKIKKTELKIIESNLINNPNIDSYTFNKLVKSFSKLPEEKIKLIVSQIGNFSQVVNNYMGYLNQSLKDNNKMVADYQRILSEQLKNENDPEIRMKIIEDLKDLHKSVNKQILLDKLHLDKVAMGGAAIISALLLAIVSKDNSDHDNKN